MVSMGQPVKKHQMRSGEMFSYPQRCSGTEVDKGFHWLMAKVWCGRWGRDHNG